MNMKIALAQFIFESNTFLSTQTELDTFQDGGIWLTEETEIRDWAAGVDSQMSGSLKVLDEVGCETVPIFAAVCNSPAGRLSTTCFKEIRTAIKEGLMKAMSVDRILLHLHGAACAVDEDDTEGNLLEMVREELNFKGRLVITVDLHANITKRMIGQVDAMTAYRTMPHRDLVETGARGARLVVASRATNCTVSKIAALIPPTDTNDLQGPFANMMARARQLEESNDVADISLFPVQPWLDVGELGSAVVITANTGKEVSHLARDLGEQWYAQRHSWDNHLMDWATIKEKLRHARNTPWILVDTADATSGGSPGNSVEALEQLLPMKDNFPGEVLLWVVDPTTVKAAYEGSARFITGQQAVEWDAEVVFTGNGNFRARGKSYNNHAFSIGETVVLKNGKLRLVACTRPSMIQDPALYECVGLDPDDALAVLVKSHKGWLASYQAKESCGLHFDGPGCTSLNFSRYPFQGKSMDLFPLNQHPLNPIELWT